MVGGGRLHYYTCLLALLVHLSATCASVQGSGVISGLVILEGRQNFQKEGHIVRFCAIKEGQYERNFIMKIHSAQTRPVKKLLV